MKTVMIVIAALALAACSESLDYLYHLSHPKHHRHVVKREYVPVPEPPAPAKTETHDELVARVHRESAQRRKDYCDSHPNLSLRIGCE